MTDRGFKPIRFSYLTIDILDDFFHAYLSRNFVGHVNTARFRRRPASHVGVAHSSRNTGKERMRDIVFNR